MDVSSLYTNIPHDKGLETPKSALNLSNPSESQTIIDLASLVLTLNDFEFNNEHYIQFNSTIMGTIMAPNYANIFMGYIKNQLLQLSPVKSHIWKRYIDDIFFN
ncbi:uncharacterized protein LOC143245566 [Tachypleus tridentatus]|uniref:uncharacterized protein LOC143245566 n=1 Tax=Tachypleus tridentatus TaxID=6853 RepID=UPI003FD51B45